MSEALPGTSSTSHIDSRALLSDYLYGLSLIPFDKLTDFYRTQR